MIKANSNLWRLKLDSSVVQMPVEDRFSIAVDRVRRVHEESGFQCLLAEEAIPTTGASEDELRSLEAELEISLPSEYRAFLASWRHLILLDGYSIWGPGLYRDQIYVDRALSEQTPYLVCGDIWCDADGDPLLLGLGAANGSAAVWSHDFGLIRPLAPTFSLALCKIVEYLFPLHSVDIVIGNIQAEIAQRNRRSWWRFWQ